jgi:hypothetical protein
MSEPLLDPGMWAARERPAVVRWQRAAHERLVMVR